MKIFHLLILLAMLIAGCQATPPARDSYQEIERDWRHPYAPLPVPNQVPF